MQMKQEKSCGAVVTDTNGRYLVIQQVQGHWCFPKGHTENNETEAETALREIREETGYDVELLDGFRYTLSYSPAPGIMKEVVYFAAQLKGGSGRNQEEEVSAIYWMDPEEVRNCITYENDRNLFEAVYAFLEKGQK